MESGTAEIRHQLALLSRRRKKGCRIVERRRKWRPGTVIDPADGQPFTDEGAWEFIAECLDDKAIELFPIPLENYPGKTGYRMVVDLGGMDLYIKVRLGTGSVIGMSFHYSDKVKEEEQ